MVKLALYIKTGCPFSRKVLQFMDENKIELPLKNISESSEIVDELITRGGKRQVPCLMIDSQALYESDDIIAWLERNYKSA